MTEYGDRNCAQIILLDFGQMAGGIFKGAHG